MTLPPLENLLRSGLKKETANDREIENLIRSGERRLKDATNATLALESVSISRTTPPTRFSALRPQFLA